MAIAVSDSEEAREKRNTYSRAYYKKNKERRSAYIREYRKKNRARIIETEHRYDRSAKRRAHRHGLTVDQYVAIHKSQGGRCAICPKIIELSGFHTHVDHDHGCCPGRLSCGRCVRGMLCRFCNTSLGHLGDSPERLRAAADYLESKRSFL